MFILGLNAYHGDSSACLVRDGELIAAAEEERFRRIKHWAGLPVEAIRYCLREGRIELGNVDHVAINRRPGVNNFRRLAFVLTHRPDPRLVFNRLRNIRKAATVEAALGQAFPDQNLRAELHHVEHHLAHLASAFLVSPFEEAVSVSIDGFGDFASAAWGMGRRQSVCVDDRVYFPHSLGIFYSAVTQYLGFPYFGDEYKVMGLAPYGEPKFIDAMRQVVHLQSDGTFRLNLKFFRHHTDNVTYSWNNCSPEVGTLYTAALEELLGPARKKDQPLEQKHKDIARSAQAMYEEAFFALLNALHQRYRCDNLALSGGCAMNSVANGKVYQCSPFKRMYLPAAAGDAGGAIGAAFVVWNELNHSTGANGRFHMSHAYTGPQFSEEEIAAVLKSRALFPGKNRDPLDLTSESAASLLVSRCADASELCEHTAKAISEGKVVGWFQGRMEWGPRALGNRSILCDPRRGDMKEILNAKIKRRESFRPFAPSILREAVVDWFETDDDVPFMMEVFQVRPEKRAQIPAVTHVDGSGRLHTVSRDANPLYHQLITEFQRLTGVPILLNTSFNENEPVVCRPEEALDCFLRTKTDVLVLGRHVVIRHQA
ncbi:MAG: carbamoyltransferase [Verrucomicrobia subdivision 3 bacterium]|nr:carbamoyltransferase [Limisphaerales bacterium]